MSAPPVLQRRRADIISQLRLAEPNDWYPVRHHTFPHRLLKLLRVALASAAELDDAAITRRALYDGSGVGPSQPLSPVRSTDVIVCAPMLIPRQRNERVALLMLASLLEARLESYGTTAEQDEAAAPSSVWRHQLAVLQRVGEKRSLAKCLSIVRLLLKQLHRAEEL